MSLFINVNLHPDVYKCEIEILEPNQSIFKDDYILKLIHEQKDMTESMSHSVQVLQKLMEEHGIQTKEQWDAFICDFYLGQKKIDSIVDAQHEFSDRMAKQEELQEDVVKRLENQEALSEKMIRQLDHIRSVLYERVHFLADKMDESIKLTSTYMYKLLTGNKLPNSFFVSGDKKK